MPGQFLESERRERTLPLRAAREAAWRAGPLAQVVRAADS
jgi:hypothetical protein